MRGVEGIIDQLHRSLEGDSWQGASIREILEGLSAREAAAHPVVGGHSIWELVYHATAWVRAVHSRVLGKVTELEGEADWPPVHDTSEKAWTAAFEDLRRSQSELIATLKTLSDVDLSAPVPNGLRPCASAAWIDSAPRVPRRADVAAQAGFAAPSEGRDVTVS